MATAVVEQLTQFRSMNLPPKPLRVCFSYAAYAKNVIHYLSSSNIPVEPGLSEAEVAAVESAFGFTFPPDLRSILHEGLPVGPGFPNWRSSSQQQLEILTTLPILGICKGVSRNEFWTGNWGQRPVDSDRAVRLARGFLKSAPPLVPIYRRFYIPATPCIAGNPVFYVHGEVVKVWSFDIAGFFQQVEFKMSGNDDVLRRPRLCNLFPAPAWAAREPRRIEFWTELAERGEAARSGTRGWWSGALGRCLEEVCRRLRNGGWKEEEVREMMMMDDCDQRNNCDEPFDNERVEWRVSAMLERLLTAGWSTEDVVEFGLTADFDRNGIAYGEDYCFDFCHTEENCDDKMNNSHTL
ncbi:hypothetical protein ACS0TY_029881 [Phlomoides rotata]